MTDDKILTEEVIPTEGEDTDSHGEVLPTETEEKEETEEEVPTDENSALREELLLLPDLRF